MYGYIYKIINVKNSKIYIGKTTKSINARFKQHLFFAKRDRSFTSYLYNAINCDGEENFKIELVDSASSEEELSRKEIYWIDKLQCRDPKIGYNIQEGGEGGAVRSAKWKPSEKQLKALEEGRHRPSSDLHKKQLSERRTGCNVSGSTREKLRENSLGRVHVHKGTENKNPKLCDLDKYLNDGWVRGQYHRKKS